MSTLGAEDMSALSLRISDLPGVLSGSVVRATRSDDAPSKNTGSNDSQGRYFIVTMDFERQGIEIRHGTDAGGELTPERSLELRTFYVWFVK